MPTPEDRLDEHAIRIASLTTALSDLVDIADSLREAVAEANNALAIILRTHPERVQAALSDEENAALAWLVETRRAER